MRSEEFSVFRFNSLRFVEGFAVPFSVLTRFVEGFAVQFSVFL